MRDIIFSQAKIWKEVLVAAIGEQFTDSLAADDDVAGLSISPREREDILQIWNVSSAAAAVEKASVIEKVHAILPGVKFGAAFYKREEKKKVLSSYKYPPNPVFSIACSSPDPLGLRGFKVQELRPDRCRVIKSVTVKFIQDHRACGEQIGLGHSRGKGVP